MDTFLKMDNKNTVSKIKYGKYGNIGLLSFKTALNIDNL